MKTNCLFAVKLIQQDNIEFYPPRLLLNTVNTYLLKIKKPEHYSHKERSKQVYFTTNKSHVRKDDLLVRKIQSQE